MASWTDNPATSSTHVRTIHINEIRSTVDNDRRKAGISPYGWTDDPLTTSTHIRAIHFTEIRTAIQQTPGAPVLSNWSVGSPPSSSRQISARDINDVRGWTDQLSAAVGQQFGPEAMSNQGIVSFSYDPTSGYTIVGPNTAWMDDVGALKPNGDKLLIRTAIQANQGNNTLGSSGYLDSTFIAQVVSAIQGKQRKYHDTMDGTGNTPTKPLVIGEWGGRTAHWTQAGRERPTMPCARRSRQGCTSSSIRIWTRITAARIMAPVIGPPSKACMSH